MCFPVDSQLRRSHSLYYWKTTVACHFDRRDGALCRPGAEKSLGNFGIQVHPIFCQRSLAPMPVKKDILDSIAAMASRMGRAPSLSEFIALSGISDYFLSQSFPSWNDAVRTAGLDPNTSNKRIEDCELLKDWGETVRKIRAIPSRRAYQREGRYDIRTIERHFGPWSSIPETFRKFAQDKPEWADLAELLHDCGRKEESRASKGRHFRDSAWRGATCAASRSRCLW